MATNKVIFSPHFEKLEEDIIDVKIKVDMSKNDLKWTKKIVKSLNLLVKKSKVLYVTEVADFNYDKRGLRWVDVEFLLPCLWTDIFTKYYWEEKFINFVYCLFHEVDHSKNPHNYKWVLTINTLPIEEDEKDTPDDPFEIIVTKKWLKQEDVVKYTKIWLDKYYPGNNIEVKFVEVY